MENNIGVFLVFIFACLVTIKRNKELPKGQFEINLAMGIAIIFIPCYFIYKYFLNGNP